MAWFLVVMIVGMRRVFAHALLESDVEELRRSGARYVA
jgi:hypothetical protein